MNNKLLPQFGKFQGGLEANNLKLDTKKTYDERFIYSRARASRVLGFTRGPKLYAAKVQEDFCRRYNEELKGKPFNANEFRSPTLKEQLYETYRLLLATFWMFFGTRALSQATIHLDPYYAEDKKSVCHDSFTSKEWQVMNPQEIPKDIATDPLWLESGCRTKKQVEALAKTRAEWEKKNPDIADDEDIEPRLIPDHPPWLSPLDRFFLKYWFKTSPAWELTEAQRIEENKRFCKPVE